jgi:hypothetical protein
VSYLYSNQKSITLVTSSCLPQISVRIALAQTCGAMHAVSLLTLISHSITSRHEMDASLRSPISLHSSSHLTFIIILIIVLPIYSMWRLQWCLRLTLLIKVMNVPKLIILPTPLHQQMLLNFNQRYWLSHLLEYVIASFGGVIVPSLWHNMLSFSFVPNSSQQASRTQRLHSHLKC